MRPRMALVSVDLLELLPVQRSDYTAVGLCGSFMVGVSMVKLVQPPALEHVEENVVLYRPI